MPTTDGPAILSPCLKLCALDAAGKTCLACGRTIGEIAAWGRMDNSARARVVARLASRSDAIDGDENHQN